MVPFCVFDRENKEMWIVLNYQGGGASGSYLMSREDDGDSDGVDFEDYDWGFDGDNFDGALGYVL